MKKTFLFIFIIAALAMTGCATTEKLTYHEITKAAQGVNIANGVDQAEALLLAQRHAIAGGMDKEYDIYKATVEGFSKDRRAWPVDLPSRYEFVTRESDYINLKLWVDAASGDITVGEKQVAE